MNDPQAEGQMASHIERREFLATTFKVTTPVRLPPGWLRLV
jgi:hypothetical protein